MAASSRLTFRRAFPLTLTIITLFAAQRIGAQQLPECSLAKTNKSCAIVIDRGNPVAPPTIQMYSGESVTVVVRDPKYFER
jgi:hypothetical protein